MRNPDRTAWRSVQINSNKWCDAHEAYPESALKHLEFTEKPTCGSPTMVLAYSGNIGTILFLKKRMLNG